MDSSVLQIVAPLSARERAISDDRESLEVVWYGEQDVTLELHAERDCAMSHIAAELIGAPTYADRVQIIRGILGIIGFSTLEYSTLRLRDGRPERACLLKNYASARSQAGYFRKRYYEIDPRAPLERSDGAPIVWNLKDLCARALRRHHDPRVTQLLRDMQAERMFSGIMFGIPYPRSGLYSLISLTSTDARQGWISSDTVGQSLALGLALHRVASGYARALAAQAKLPNPAGMQRKILSCLVNGMSNHEIASRLNMTPHNVDIYLSVLEERYCVSNRAQLAFIAGRTLAV
jgi:DNA-binding CsgD family transcriptional regulator